MPRRPFKQLRRLAEALWVRVLTSSLPLSATRAWRESYSCLNATLAPSHRRASRYAGVACMRCRVCPGRSHGVVLSSHCKLRWAARRLRSGGIVRSVDWVEDAQQVLYVPDLDQRIRIDQPPGHVTSVHGSRISFFSSSGYVYYISVSDPESRLIPKANIYCRYRCEGQYEGCMCSQGAEYSPSNSSLNGRTARALARIIRTRRDLWGDRKPTSHLWPVAMNTHFPGVARHVVDTGVGGLRTPHMNIIADHVGTVEYLASIGDPRKAVRKGRLRIEKAGMLSYRPPKADYIYAIFVLGGTHASISSVYDRSRPLRGGSMTAVVEDHLRRYTEFYNRAPLSPQVSAVFAELLSSSDVPVLGRDVQATVEWPPMS